MYNETTVCTGVIGNSAYLPNINSNGVNPVDEMVFVLWWNTANANDSSQSPTCGPLRMAVSSILFLSWMVFYTV